MSSPATVPAGASSMCGMLPADDGPLCRAGLVEAADGRGVRRASRDLRIRGRLLEDGPYRVHEPVEALLRLRLRRLDHEGLLDEQREVHGRRMHAVVEQALRQVERPDT